MTCPLCGSPMRDSLNCSSDECRQEYPEIVRLADEAQVEAIVDDGIRSFRAGLDTEGLLWEAMVQAAERLREEDAEDWPGETWGADSSGVVFGSVYMGSWGSVCPAEPEGEDGVILEEADWWWEAVEEALGDAFGEAGGFLVLESGDVFFGAWCPWEDVTEGDVALRAKCAIYLAERAGQEVLV